MSETRTVDGIEWESLGNPVWWLQRATDASIENPGRDMEPRQGGLDWVLLEGGHEWKVLGHFETPEAAMHAYASTRPTARKEQE